MVYKDENKRCIVEGCNAIGEWNKSINGKIYRRKWCTKHRKRFYGIAIKKKSKSQHDKSRRKLLQNGSLKKCSICGWDKANCDMHRTTNGGSYKIDNIKVLCPNCHRLVHLGLLII